MRDYLGLFFGLTFLIAGAVLLYNGMSNDYASQSAAIIGGATFLSLGAVVMWIRLRDWWEWRKEYREYRKNQFKDFEDART